MRQIKHSIWLEAPPEIAYDYATSPVHWYRWYPGTVAVEGNAGFPLVVGDIFTERIRTLGVAGKLSWITVESTRPSRFVVETTSVEMPLMHRAHFRITYSFEPPEESPARHTRMVRRLEYEFNGVAGVLDRVYLHEYMKRKAAFALTKLQRLMRTEAAGGP
jgi:ligand-binding SRPBCC domain-containing protein